MAVDSRSLRQAVHLQLVVSEQFHEVIANGIRSISVEDVALLRQSDSLLMTCHHEAMHVVVQLLSHFISCLHTAESGCRMVAHSERKTENAVAGLLLVATCGGLLKQHGNRAKRIAINISCTEGVAIKLILGEVLRSDAIEGRHVVV